MTASPAPIRPPFRQAALWHRLIPPRWRLPAFFDAEWYRGTYPDMARARGGAAIHWLRHGRHEGRLPCAIAAARAEAALWQGDPQARPKLHRLTLDPAPVERIWATLALARAAAARGDAAAALALLNGLDPVRDLAEGLGMVRPLAFLAATAVQEGDTMLARQGIELLHRCCGAAAETHLLRAGLAAIRADHQGWGTALAPLYAPAGLAPPMVGGGDDGAPFDRLAGRAAQVVADGPLVSIIMPARNAAATIATALRGLVAQGWQALEILVVDNGSTDATAAEVRRWQARDPRIRLLDGAAAPGAYGARNLGRDAARGEFLALHDADDWSHPDRIAGQMRLMQPGATPAAMAAWVRLGDDLVPSALRPDVDMIHANLSSLMIRRSAAERTGYWDEVTAGADSEYVARLHRVLGPRAVAMVLPGVPLAFGRIVAGSLSRSAETGLFGAGSAARASYRAAAEHWHDTATDLCLPRSPARRPFPAPPALLSPAQPRPEA